MASVNKVIIVGNLGKDPEVRSFPNGDSVANVSIATTDRWKDKTTGEMKEATEWHRINFSGRLAEIAGQYLKKGSAVYVEGSLRTRKWTDKDGMEKSTTEIRADSLQMLGGKSDATSSNGRAADKPSSNDTNGYAAASGRSAPRTPAPQAQAKPTSGFDDMDDDIPF